ncbi:hypothetical protein [Pseudonocardia alni]|uniref:hypothetical protein n=1 Tax=Pseudonocardia alni TaxID=33907 RepID=UPI001AD6FFC9|nr:hypothetical protein [Pseudonocardia alni]MBO4236425.1 hypothetical protein [Pseudonocardia alni]
MGEPTAVGVRAATPSDAPGIADVCARAYRVTYRARGFVERDRVPMHTSAADDDLWSLRMHRDIARSSRQS